MPSHYRAVVCRGFSNGDTAIEKLPREPLRPGQVRVQIRACGVNYPDVLIVEGKYQYKPDLPFVPGVEAAGRIVEVGEGVPSAWLGTDVMVGMRTGAYAEEAVVAAERAVPMPVGFGFEEGATFLVGHTTAYHALATCGQLGPGQSVLVLGAGGGVGRAGVQVAKHLGAFVIATASTGEKAALARSAGADLILDPSAPDLPSLVKAATTVNSGREGVDVVYDPVGVGSEIALRSVAWGGRVLLVGFAGGTLPHYAANRILLKGALIIGVRAGEFARRFPERRLAEMDEILKLAKIHRPIVTASFQLEQFHLAHDALRLRRAAGRIVLLP